MLSETYSRATSNPGLAPGLPATLAATPRARLDASLSQRAELALSLAVVALTSSAVWNVSSWLLARWQLH
jgi:hypothetical protein